MPLYTQQASKFGSHVGKVRDKRDVVNEYCPGDTDQRMSVYSPHAVITLHRRFGACHGCGFNRELVNDYCDVCRCCGANEAQCLDPKRIK